MTARIGIQRVLKVIGYLLCRVFLQVPAPEFVVLIRDAIDLSPSRDDLLLVPSRTWDLPVIWEGVLLDLEGHRQNLSTASEMSRASSSREPSHSVRSTTIMLRPEYTFRKASNSAIGMMLKQSPGQSVLPTRYSFRLLSWT